MEKLEVALETKQFDSDADVDNYVLEGYASIFDNKDLDDDVMVKGSFTESLKSRSPQLLYGHDLSSVPIGLVKEAREDNRGLRFKGLLPKNDDFVRGRLAPQLKLGSLKGISIGFRVKDRENRKGVRYIKQAELFEISLVNVPANPLANVEGFKSLGVQPYAELDIAGHGPGRWSRDGWDRDDAIKRLRGMLDVKDTSSADYKSAFLYVDPEDPDNPDACKFCIADVIDGEIVAIPSAIFKAAAALAGARGGESLEGLTEDARKGIAQHLKRYYRRMELECPTKSLSSAEFESLNVGEREARLRALGLSRALSKSLLTGQRDADPNDLRDAGEDGLADLVKHIRNITQEIKR